MKDYVKLNLLEGSLQVIKENQIKLFDSSGSEQVIWPQKVWLLLASNYIIFL